MSGFNFFQQQHIECLPLSLRRMCLQNKEMKQDIQAYQQVSGTCQSGSYLLASEIKNNRHVQNKKNTGNFIFVLFRIVIYIN